MSLNENIKVDNKERGMQSQKFIDKQKQSLLYSYETLGNLLSSAENFAGFPNEQYENYNISTTNNKDELKSEFAWELNCFQMSLKKYKKKYGEYIYPEKYSKEKLLKDIQRYIKNTSNEKDKVLFLAMINILNGDKTDIDFNQLFEELENHPNNKFDPNKLSSLIGPINSILENIEKNAEEGKIVFNENKSKLKDKLAKEKNKKSDKINGIIGKKGILYIIKEANNKYKFINKENKKEEIIILNEKINLKNKKLYLGKCEDKTITIYFNDKNTDSYYCTLFNQNVQEYEKSDIVILDNNFGYLKVPFLLSEDFK